MEPLAPPPKHPSTLQKGQVHARSTSSSSASAAASTELPPPPPPPLPRRSAAPYPKADTAMLTNDVERSILIEPPTPVTPAQISANVRASELTEEERLAASLLESSTDAESDSSASEVDEAFEEIAAEIAGAGRKAQHGAVANHGRDAADMNSNLRRRHAPVQAAEPSEKDFATSTAIDEMQRALQELEDVEVAVFLKRVGDRVQEVRIAPPREKIDFPDRKSFEADGKMDWVSYGVALANTAIIAYTPPSLLCPPKKDHFSVTYCRGELERYYIVAPPSTLSKIFGGDLAKIWRWQSANTWKYAGTYSLFWFFDIVPALIPLALLYQLLNSRLYPPSPQTLLLETMARTSRNREAHELSRQLKVSGRIGFAAESARGAILKVIDRATGNQREQGPIATALGSLLDPEVLQRARTMRAQTLGPRQAARSTRQEPRAEGEEAVKGPDGKVSLYELFKEVSKAVGPSAQEFLHQGADLGEMLKNIILHPDHPSVRPIILRLSVICLYLLFMPQRLIWKSFWGYLGVEFFVLWHMRELYPQYRRALTPIWWLLLGAPTDAEYATHILTKRAAEHRPLRGRKTIKRQQRARARAESDAASLAPSSMPRSSTLERLTGGHLSLTPSRDSASSSRSASVHEKDPSTSSHFAIYNSMPGTLTIDTSNVRFVSSRNMNKMGLDRLARRIEKSKRKRRRKRRLGLGSTDDNSSSAQNSDEEDDGAFNDDDDDYAFSIKVADLVGVKKQSRFGLEGLQLTSKDDKVRRLSNVSRREDAFNRLLSSSPATWTRATVH